MVVVRGLSLADCQPEEAGRACVYLRTQFFLKDSIVVDAKGVAAFGIGSTSRDIDVLEVKLQLLITHAAATLGEYPRLSVNCGAAPIQWALICKLLVASQRLLLIEALDMLLHMRVHICIQQQGNSAFAHPQSGHMRG